MKLTDTQPVMLVVHVDHLEGGGGGSEGSRFGSVIRIVKNLEH